MRLHELYGPGFAFSEAVVDRESRLIRNVSLLGRTSKNNRIYSEKAMSEAADLYKGTGVFVDHPTRSEERETGGVRSFRDLTGRVITASVRGDRVRGDIQVLEGEDGDKLLAVAEHMPGAAGFSHRAQGEFADQRTDEGLDVVESLTDVQGADIVTDPATVNGLFESLNHQEDEMDLSELDLATLRSERPDLVESISEEAETAASVEELKEQNAELRKENDELQVKLSAREQSDLIETKLGEADLPDFVVTDLFREQLEGAEDEDAIDALIAERQELAKRTKGGGPKSTGRDFDEAARGPDEGETEEVTGEVLEEAYDSLFV